MNFDDFQASRNEATHPADLPPALQALWLDGKGDWESAHTRIQDANGADAAWVHAYLHRKEGDLSNAAYWYRRAGQPTASGPLETEWEAIARSLLASEGEPSGG